MQPWSFFYYNVALTFITNNNNNVIPTESEYYYVLVRSQNCNSNFPCPIFSDNSLTFPIFHYLFMTYLKFSVITSFCRQVVTLLTQYMGPQKCTELHRANIPAHPTQTKRSVPRQSFYFWRFTSYVSFSLVWDLVSWGTSWLLCTHCGSITRHVSSSVIDSTSMTTSLFSRSSSSDARLRKLAGISAAQLASAAVARWHRTPWRFRLQNWGDSTNSRSTSTIRSLP